MKAIGKSVFLLLLCGLTVFSTADSACEVPVFYGTSDASAAVAMTEDMFIVADDEHNILRVYKTSQPSLPVFSYDLTSFLGIEPGHPEADIEGATMFGDTVYWITSHGRNTDGKVRPNRYRFFAVKIDVNDKGVNVEPLGEPCRTLVNCLLKADNLSYLNLDKSVRMGIKKLPKKRRKELAPKKKGLNIEALCASADGNTLYIGFRNPRPSSKAIVVPLNNPRQVIENQKPPIFADPILWDLKGYGIRSMEYSNFHRAYFLIAGPHNDDPAQFVLYRWSGKINEQPLFIGAINPDFNPEALVVFKNSPKLLLLSDDGSLPVDVSDASECMKGKLRKGGKCLNKHLTNSDKKHFRAIWFQP